MAPARKKAKVTVQPTTIKQSSTLSLTTLPIEILAEILICTHHPPTVLAVSRTCSSLHRFLAQNPAASFIWRGVRQTCQPLALPDPGDLWNGNEADYAAFVFGTGVCEVCRRHTPNMYASFATRIRLCGSWHCRVKLLHQHTIDATILFGPQRESLWVPHVESNRCFRSAPDPSAWPDLNTIILRKTDLVKYQHDVKTVKEAEQAQAARKHAGDSAPISKEEEERRERTMQRCNAAVQRFPEIMKISVLLNEWKNIYDREYRFIKQRNKVWVESIAQRLGWNLDDFVASQTYGSLQRRKNFILEMIQQREIVPLLPKIESEILVIQAHRKRQKAEETYKERLTEIKKIYERMRCGSLKADLAETPYSCDTLALPPMSVFCTLPSVRALKGTPDPNAVLSSGAPAVNDIKSSPLTMSLITSDIRAWLVPIRKHVLRLLGCPNGWQCASTLIVPPWQRITARFFCRRCGEGKVARGYQRELCLDFKGVCSHVCVTTQRKAIESQQGEIENEEGGEGKSKGKGKKKGVKALEWNVELFERDDKAIRIIRTILVSMNYPEKHRDTEDKLKAVCVDLRCTSCKGWIVMDYETAIGHAHRHESMAIDVVIGRCTRRVEVSKDVANVSHGNFTFERGTTEILLGPSRRARGLWNKVNYGCRHCLIVEEAGSEVVITIKKRAMNFNGLRSHVEEKHGIQDIRDEDFFCYTSIQKDGGNSNQEGNVTT